MSAAAVTIAVVVPAAIALLALLAARHWRAAARAADGALRQARRDGIERERHAAAADAVAADLAHDLNDLLTGIAGHAELVIVTLDREAPGLADAREILRLASGAAHLTRPLRSLGPERQALSPASRTAAAVLVVEDEPGMRDLIMAVLSRAGHTVIAAEGPRAALAALARQPAIALMVVDLVMPEMDGYALVAEARVAAPALPVIFVSAFAPDSRRQASGDRFLAKPFSADALAAAVGEALAGPGQRPSISASIRA